MTQGAQYSPGQVFPGTVYRVIRHLATGGMGSVYDVEDTSVEKRYVLKTLHPQLIAREDLALRMRDEAKSLAKLQHPNIVEVITAGVTRDALKMPFYVMERLDGQNLRTVLERRGALDATHAYHVAIDVADALQHAHENAIVHRDVKPENIFLHRNAGSGTTTKLLDFGIVRLLDRKVSLTHGKFIGTMRYASPEQIAGHPIGPATDIYSLGAVLFEMLCGRGPFDDAGDMYAIGAAHAKTPAPPLSRFTRATPEVDRVLAWALAKDPAERPQDARAFAVELRRLLQLEEAEARVETVANVLGGGGDESATATHVGDSAVPDSAPTSADPSAAATPRMDGAPAPPPTTRNERAVNPVGPTMIASPAPASASTRAVEYAPPGMVARVAAPAASRTSPATEAIVPPTAPSPGVVPRHIGASPAAAAAVVDAPAAVAVDAPRGIDRSAPTRPSPIVGGTKRMAHNDTQIESLLPRREPAGTGNLAPGAGVAAGETGPRPLDRAPRTALVLGAAVATVLIAGSVGAFVKLRARPAAAPAATLAPAAGAPAPARTASTP